MEEGFITKDELREKAKEKIAESYGNFASGSNELYLAHYWAKLFPLELEIVKKKAIENESKLLLPTSESIMIMTLGTSLEPLVLAAHLVNPQKLFILSTDSIHVRNLKKALEQTGLTDCQTREINLGKGATSASVFKALRGKGDPSVSNPELPGLSKILQDKEQRTRIVFDITGAKKTISGGCLLFAAYYDIPVYYMDFGDDPDDYHPDLGRPLPGACFYTRQKNPVAGFCLKDIEGIRDHFDKGQYGIAAELLNNARGKMDKDYFVDPEIKLYDGLFDLTRIYMDWIGGWWGDVHNKIDTLPPLNQPYVKKLSAYPKQNRKEWREPVFQTDLYDKHEEFLTYLVMELATLSRAAANKTMNHRSIFLRIFGLEEILVGFMCYRLILMQKIKAEPDINEATPITVEEHIKLSVTCNYAGLEGLLLGMYPSILQELYRPNDGQKYKWSRDKHKVKLCPSGTTLNLCDDTMSTLLKFVSKRKLRNKAVHSITPVDEDTARIIRDVFEKLLRSLLSAASVEWFDGVTNLDEVKELLDKKDDWSEDVRVSPMKWDACESLIKAASAASSTTP